VHRPHGGLNRTTRSRREPIPIPRFTRRNPSSGRHWAVLVAGSRPRSTSPRTAGVVLWGSSPPWDNGMTRSPSISPSPRSRWPGPAPDGARTRPDAVLADKAYSSHAIRAQLSRRGIKAVIAIKDDQRAARRRKGSRGGRPPSFDEVRYRDATPSNEQSTSSARTAPSPPATTNATTPTVAPSPSPQSRSGSATLSEHHYGTRPSRWAPEPVHSVVG
jgi:hypothetical protein